LVILQWSVDVPSSARAKKGKSSGRSTQPTETILVGLMESFPESDDGQSEMRRAKVLVEHHVADKALEDQLEQSGAVPRLILQYAIENGMEPFTPAQSERMVRTLRITGLARDAFGDKADEWLDRPTTVFSGATPAEMLVTEAGARAVEMFIGQAMHGFAA
jgi:putative toxin-antitoxin system antitoxin component (TIGR02293 family)